MNKECTRIKRLIDKSKYQGHAYVSGKEIKFFLDYRGKEAILTVTNGMSNYYRLGMIRQVLNGDITFNYFQDYCQRLVRF